MVHNTPKPKVTGDPSCQQPCLVKRLPFVEQTQHRRILCNYCKRSAILTHIFSAMVFRRRPYRVECTGSLSTSEVKQHRARLVLGWGTAWEDLRVLSAFSATPSFRTMQQGVRFCSSSAALCVLGHMLQSRKEARE